MNELWRELIHKKDAELAKPLSLSRVQISKSTGEMTIWFDSSRLFVREEYKRLGGIMRSAFPNVRVSVHLRYPDLKYAVERDISIASQLLFELLEHESPGSVPFLAHTSSDLTLVNGKLNVSVSSAEGVNYLKSRGVDEMLRRLLRELFDISASVSIVVTGDEEKRIENIRLEREREERIFREAAAKLKEKANGNGAKPAPSAVVGRAIKTEPVEMKTLAEDSGNVVLTGEVAAFELRNTKNGQTKIVTFALTDHTGSVNCKLFLGGKRMSEDAPALSKQIEAVENALKNGNWVTVRGEYAYDDFKRDMQLMVRDIEIAAKPVREDTSKEKRVELHLHTQMSALDACASATELIKQAKAWGHKAIAITDHGVVQAFPEAFSCAEKNGIKLIPGCEGYMIDDLPKIVDRGDSRSLDDCAYVVLDIETTGLNPAADAIIEIGAVRIENGAEVAEFSQLIDPERVLPERITELTGITSAMLHGEPSEKDVLPRFAKFISGAVLVAHNAAFDMGFLSRAFKRVGLPLKAPVIDTLALARNQYPELRNHKLNTICKELDISLKDAHRAVHDARATSLLLMKALDELRHDKHVSLLSDINKAYKPDAGGTAYHIIFLAKNQKGVENLYRLVSEAHLNYFHRTPRIPRGLIKKHREGLIIGSACEAGELYRAVLSGKDDKALRKIAKFYDYLEIQPEGNNEFLVRDGTLDSIDEVRAINKRILELGDELNIPVVATGDVHFKDPADSVFRTIIMAAKGFEDSDHQAPLYFKTTNEMLSDFEYLGADAARRVVIEAPNAIADMIGDVHFHIQGKDTYQPYWEDAEDELKRITLERAHEIYGAELPDIVQKRIDKEMHAIVKYGFSTLYMIAVKLVAKSLADGYIVGSRGSVGSSFAAFLSGITDVNSLPPHYVCPKCKSSEFDVPAQFTCGLDLPKKYCPDCGAEMLKDGFNIPFEVFLGFHGDKVPDIDLNFSSEYQSVAHNYVKQLFGAENVFRAGTISTVAEKTAYGYVLKYMEERGVNITRAERERLARGITGVKRSTGQHPAGMVVLPKDYNIYQFTPIQRPANDMSSDTITTHFDFRSMHDVLVKLDVLGHDNPTMLRRLQDITGIAPQSIPLEDAEVFKSILSLFSGTSALNITEEELGVSTGTIGIPEFGTPFVRGMLMETKPSSTEELIRISGLSHGTDVWLNNTQDLVSAGVPLRECICTRDDIMNALIALDMNPSTAFEIMERVRRGKGLTPDMEEAINAVNAPSWYTASCNKIKYMFPKAHAVAYVTMALRIAYFKIYYPTAFYTCHLMRNAESFDGTYMTTRSIGELRSALKALNDLEQYERAQKADEIAMLETLIEMNLRGVMLKPISLYKSDATKFMIDDDGEIVPPISALPGVGAAAAEAFTRIRDEGEFISVDDMKRRNVAKSTIEYLRQAGCLNGIPESSQVTLFDFDM